MLLLTVNFGSAQEAASVGADLNMVDTLAAKVMSEAIRRAVDSSRVDDAGFLKYIYC